MINRNQKMLEWAAKKLETAYRQKVSADSFYEECLEDYESIYKLSPTKRAMRKYQDWIAMQPKELR